jgi:hypothetical protein
MRQQCLQRKGKNERNVLQNQQKKNNKEHNSKISSLKSKDLKFILELDYFIYSNSV